MVGEKDKQSKYATDGTSGTWFWIKTARMGILFMPKSWNDELERLNGNFLKLLMIFLLLDTLLQSTLE